MSICLSIKCLSFKTIVTFTKFFLIHKEEAAVDEWMVYWIHTPQVPGSRPGWYGTFYQASDWLPP